jgi:hypothetical protein
VLPACVCTTTVAGALCAAPSDAVYSNDPPAGAASVYETSPPASATASPAAGFPALPIASGSFSTSASFASSAKAGTTIGEPSGTLVRTMSPLATGASFTPFTVIVTVETLLSAVPSFAR